MPAPREASIDCWVLFDFIFAPANLYTEQTHLKGQSVVISKVLVAYISIGNNTKSPSSLLRSGNTAMLLSQAVEETHVGG